MTSIRDGICTSRIYFSALLLSKTPREGVHAAQRWKAGVRMLNGSRSADGGAVLILYHRPTMVADCTAVCAQMLADGRFNPVLLCPDPVLLALLPPEVREAVPAVDWRGRELPGCSDAPETMPQKGSDRSAALRIAPVAALGLVVKIASGLFRFKRLLRKLDVVAVVVFDDRIPFPEATLLRAARALAVPAILIPYAVSSPEADAFVRRGDKTYLLSAPVRHWIKRWIIKCLPGHVRKTKFGRMSFYRPWDTLVLAAFGIAGHRPWVWGAGPVSKVAAFGQKHRSDMIALGVAPDKIDAVGQVALDGLFRSQARAARIRDALLKQAGLSDDRPIFICALPQHAEHGMSSWADHLPATRALLQSLGSSGAHVFVSLHPRSKPSMYREIISECGCHLLHQTFIDAIPAADCVFATFSSVLRWALLVGVPCVVVDQIGHNLPIYDGAEGVVIVKDGEEVSKIARRMVTDELWRNRLGSCAAVCARSNERFDGNAGARLVATLAGLVRDMEQVR